METDDTPTNKPRRATNNKGKDSRRSNPQKPLCGDRDDKPTPTTTTYYSSITARGKIAAGEAITTV